MKIKKNGALKVRNKNRIEDDIERLLFINFMWTKNLYGSVAQNFVKRTVSFKPRNIKLKGSILREKDFI